MKQYTAIILLFLFFLVPAHRAAAQLMHGLGLGLVTGFGKLPKDADPTESQPFLGARYISYYPRFQVTSGDYNSITIGMPLIVGLGGSIRTNTSYYVDLPLMIDANAGAGSTPNDDSPWGYGIGLGFGYALTGSTYTYLDNSFNTVNKKIRSYGPMANIHLRRNIGNSVISVRSAYKMGLNDMKYNLFDIAVYLLF